MADLTKYLKGKRPGPFQPSASYVPDGDTLIFYFKEDESYGERIDELLTVYRSMQTRQVVGCQIKSVRVILQRLGQFGVHVRDGDVDLRVIFLGYAFVSGKMPPSEPLQELRNAAESANTRVPLAELVHA